MTCVLESRVLKMPEYPEIQEFRIKDLRNKHSTTIGTLRFEKPTTTLSKSSNAECNQKYSKNINFRNQYQNFNALSFYRSQNVLGQSKFFCASQTKNLFTCCGSQKDDLHSVKLVFVCRRHKRFWRGTKCSQSFGLAQKIWTGSKHFGTCKRTRQKYSSWLMTLFTIILNDLLSLLQI